VLRMTVVVLLQGMMRSQRHSPRESINGLDVAQQRCHISWPGNVRVHRRRLPKPRLRWIDKQRVVPPIAVRPVRSLREFAGGSQVVRQSRPSQSRPVFALPIEG
jgi:hypothetical protein